MAPRDGTQTYILPFPDVIADTTIESPVYNGFTNDVAQDLNNPRPISSGGTGATSAAGALAALGGEAASQVVTNYDSFIFMAGSFYSAAGATAAPNAHAFSGICYLSDASNIVIEARDSSDGKLYIRRKVTGVWGAWTADDAGLAAKVSIAGDTMTGMLVLPATVPTLGTHATNKTYVDTADAAIVANNTSQDTAIGNRVRYDAPHSPVLTAVQSAQARANIGAPLRGAIAGLTLNAPGGIGQFTTAAGEAADATGADLMKLTTSYAKSTSSWAVGASAGGLDFGTIAANTWYHVHLMKRLDTGVVDVCYSLGVAGPTTGGANPIPAAYTLFRRIGSIRTDGSLQWIAFTQLGDDFVWAAPTLDVNDGTIVNVAKTYALTVPPSVQVYANIRGNIISTSAAVVLAITSFDETAAAAAASTGVSTAITNAASQLAAFGQFLIRTDTSRQIRAVTNLAAAGAQTLRCATVGWVDRRGRDL